MTTFNTAMPFTINRVFGKYYNTTDNGDELREYKGQLFVVDGGYGNMPRTYCHIGTPNDYRVSVGLMMMENFDPKNITRAQLDSAEF